MPFSARITLFCGFLILALTLFNAQDAGQAVSPSLQRSQVLAGLSSVGLMLVAILWTRALPKKPKAIDLEGSQVFKLKREIIESLRTELAWGSHAFLTATPAAVILVYFDGEELLRRGLSSNREFVPGEICERSLASGKIISLVKTELYPGKEEFNQIVSNVPSVIVCPLEKRGILIVGGCSERCFSLTDEKWIQAWGEKITSQLITNQKVT